MKIDGRCHCGSISYEADIDPDRVSICHCTDCQSLTGSPFRVTIMTSRGNLRLTGREPRTYVKTGDNGRRRIQQFCPDCGSPMFTTGEGTDAQIWGIRWGSVRQRIALVPRRQIWCGSAVAWIDAIGELPGVDRD